MFLPARAKGLPQNNRFIQDRAPGWHQTHPDPVFKLYFAAALLSGSLDE